LFEDDSKLEAIWKSQHSLLEVIDPKNFKSYDELKKRLDRVLRNSSVGYKPTTVEQLRSESKPVKPTLSEVESSFVDEEDDDLNYFRNLIEED
jgi:hypothetical protein